MTAHLFFTLSELRSLGENAIVGRTVRVRYPDACSVGQDSVIDDFTYVSVDCEIGRAVHIAPSCTILGGRSCRVVIGDGSNLSAGVTLAGSSVEPDSIKGYSWFDGALSGSESVARDTYIGRFVLIGANTVIMDGVTIGEGAMVGAGAVVTHDVPPWEIWAGVPARKIGDRLEHRESITAMWERFARERYGEG